MAFAGREAYRARGKARRFLGDYALSAQDLSQAQTIDYDDGVVELHKYVQTRTEKMRLKAAQAGGSEGFRVGFGWFRRGSDLFFRGFWLFFIDFH